MIKKKIFFILLIIIMISTYVFANTVIDEENKEPIVSVSSSQVIVGSDFYLVLNLSKISFSKFKVDIVNTESLPTNEVTSKVSNLSSNEVATSFIVDKTVINLDKLGVIFTATNNPSKVKFEVTITNLDITAETLKENLEIRKEELKEYEEQLKISKELLQTSNEETDTTTLNEEIKKLEALITSKNTEISELEKQILEFEAEALNSEVLVEIIEENKNKLEKEELNKEEIEKEFEKQFEKEMNKNKQEMTDKMKNLQNDLDKAQSTISTLTKNVTYQGSQNNYLKSLSITDFNLGSSFKKTTNTYFATVDKNTDKVTVNAIAEDSTAIVTIYGNTNLQEGKNKILVTVTADDGTLRTYKIYITK